MSRQSYHTGRILLSLIVIAIGIMTIMEGDRIYDKYLHSIRKTYLPNSKGSDMAFNLNITFEQLN